MKRGVRESDRVALLGNNSVEYILTLMALLRITAVACPISPRLPDGTISKLIELIVCGHSISFYGYDRKTIISGVNRIDTGDILASAATGRPAGDTITLEQDATILFTSGSSGEPKAVLHSYGNHYHSALGSNGNIPFGQDDRWLLSLPLYHVGGIGILFRAVLDGGAVVVPHARQNLDETILQHRVTHISLVPTQLYRLIQHTEEITRVSKQLETILLGGGPAPKPLIEETVKYRLPLCTSYGLTEMASQVTTTARSDPPEKLATSGKLLDHRELKISAEKEILVRGETLFRGYVEGDQLNRTTDHDGWFATGDVGAIDKDGYLTFTGRKDNMFISGGENIHPEEIENALYLLPSIVEALVVPKEDAEYGLRPVAFVRYAGDSPPDHSALVTHLEKHLSRFKIPDTFHAWPDKTDSVVLKSSRARFAELARRLSETES